jgi:hypothetical protein
MIWLFLRDQVIQVPEGESVQVRASAVFVLDHDGRSLEQHDVRSVLLNTKDDRLANLLKRVNQAEGLPERKRSTKTQVG